MPAPTLPSITVEVAVDSLAGARAAAAAGADRLELCASLGEGGLTPSLGLCAAVAAAVRIPVFAMLRPRPGDFLYDDGEFEVMRRDLHALRAAGAAGFVAGALLADGRLDGPRLRALRDLAAPLPLTCHRAFDLAADPHAALDVLLDLGIPRLLTSGQAPSAAAGSPTIAALVARAGDRLAVMAGGGVRAATVAALIARTGVREVHLAAGAPRDSAMTFRRPGVPLGSPPAGDFTVRTTDGAEVARLVAVVRGR